MTIDPFRGKTLAVAHTTNHFMPLCEQHGQQSFAYVAGSSGE